MTQNEERGLMGDVAAELVEVRKRIGCLETKVEQYRRTLSQASRAMSEDDADEVFPNGENWPTVADMEEVRDALNSARTRRWKLITRMKEWGVIE